MTTKDPRLVAIEARVQAATDTRDNRRRDLHVVVGDRAGELNHNQLLGRATALAHSSPFTADALVDLDRAEARLAEAIDELNHYYAELLPDFIRPRAD